MPEASRGLTDISKAELCWEGPGNGLWFPESRDYVETWSLNQTTVQETLHEEGTGRACTLLVFTVVVAVLRAY